MKSITCPLCPAKFEQAVGLTFHIREEHPGAVDKSRELLARLARQERVEAKSNREIEAVRKVDSLYRHGCACGNDYQWHLAQRAAVGDRGN
jgi:hypothetical protein